MYQKSVAQIERNASKFSVGRHLRGTRGAPVCPEGLLCVIYIYIIYHHDCILYSSIWQSESMTNKFSAGTSSDIFKLLILSLNSSTELLAAGEVAASASKLLRTADLQQRNSFKKV